MTSCCLLMQDAIEASEKSALSRNPVGIRREAVIMGDPERLTVILIYKPPGRNPQEMLVTHCPFCGRKLSDVKTEES